MCRGSWLHKNGIDYADIILNHRQKQQKVSLMMSYDAEMECYAIKFQVGRNALWNEKACALLPDACVMAFLRVDVYE